VEYRRLGGGGGWPATFLDVAAAADRASGLEEGPVTVIGHSAGGQLALWAAARARLPQSSVGARPATVVSKAVGVAPVADLAAAAAVGIGGESTSRFVRSIGPYLGLASPKELLPIGVPQVVAVAEDDELVPASYVETYARAAAEARDEIIRVDPGGGHFGVLDPGGEPWAKLAAGSGLG
jgi:acetyl esterase/lipase